MKFNSLYYHFQKVTIKNVTTITTFCRTLGILQKWVEAGSRKAQSYTEPQQGD